MTNPIDHRLHPGIRTAQICSFRFTVIEIHCVIAPISYFFHPTIKAPALQALPVNF